MPHYTVWSVSSPSTGESKLIVHPFHVDDRKHQHEYQKIVWCGEAPTKLDALMCGPVAHDAQNRA